MEKYEFEYEYKGKKYNCYREVYGERVFRQTITVLGIGSKRDTTKYDKLGRYYSVSGMASDALYVAEKLIKNHLEGLCEI